MCILDGISTTLNFGSVSALSLSHTHTLTLSLTLSFTKLSKALTTNNFIPVILLIVIMNGWDRVFSSGRQFLEWPAARNVFQNTQIQAPLHRSSQYCTNSSETPYGWFLSDYKTLFLLNHREILKMWTRKPVEFYHHHERSTEMKYSKIQCEWMDHLTPSYRLIYVHMFHTHLHFFRIFVCITRWV